MAKGVSKFNVYKAVKKEHVCDWCGGRIRKGGYYVTWMDYDSKATFHAHGECHWALVEEWKRHDDTPTFAGMGFKMDKSSVRGCACLEGGPCCPECTKGMEWLGWYPHGVPPDIIKHVRRNAPHALERVA